MAELLAANQITIAKVLDGADGEMSAEQLAQLNQASSDASEAKTDASTAKTTAQTANSTAQAAQTKAEQALKASSVTTETLKAESARIDNLETGKANIADLNAEKARIDTLETNKADISTLNSETARIDNLIATKASIESLDAESARIDNLESTKADITSLNAGIARIDALETGKADIDLANVNNAWITNGVIKDASIANEKVISVSANKLTAGTIDASKITVTNLNADNITVGTINGARIGDNSIDLDKLSQEVPTKEYLDSVEQKLQEEIDGAIETFTVSEIPTLNNEPAVNWATDDIKSTHVGDLCYVVNNASDNDGFCYRFQYNGTVYSWALIKDNDVTKAIQDIAELDGEVTQFKTDYTSKVSEIDGGIESLKSRTTTIETTYSTKTYAEDKANDALASANDYTDTAVSTKVEKSVFNTLKNTVDENSANITSLAETVTTKADSSTVTALSNTVNEVKQTADANSSSISNLTTTVNSKADGSKVTALETKTSTIEQNLSGVTTRVTNLESENDGLDTRLTTAESKITDDAIVSTVTSSKTYKDALSGKVDTSVYNTKMEQLDNSISLKATATDVYTKTQADAAFDAKGSAATAKSEAISSANSYTDTATTDMATEEFVTSQGYLTVTSDAITSKVSKNEVISAINQTAESVSINANKINLTGAVTFSSFDNSLKTTINNKAETSALEDVRTVATNAAKVATNFMEYDSNNGLIVGNKTSGSWSGYRSQILPGSFNVLDPSSTVLASFGPTTIIGEEAKANMHLTFNNLSMVDKDGVEFFKVGDNRNAEGIATVKHSERTSVSNYGETFVTVNADISSIVSVYVDSVELSSSSYSLYDNIKVIIRNLTPNTNIYVEITYTTLDPYFYLTFGNRLPSSEVGMYSVAEGRGVTASGYCSHAEGNATTASGNFSHAEGSRPTASGYYSHAEGYNTTASGRISHAEGSGTTASGRYSHAEGVGATASSDCSHAEGYDTIASSDYSHAEGRGATASGVCSHAEGYYTTASGQDSHAGGRGTIADGETMTAIGQYNTENSGKAFVVGNGTSDTARSDAFTVDWDGNTVMKGGLTLGTALSIANGGTGATSLAAAQENLGIKANSERIDNLILGTGTSPVEVQDARLSSDGTQYTTLKSRLDAENSELKSDLNYINEPYTFVDGYYVKYDNGQLVADPNNKYTEFDVSLFNGGVISGQTGIAPNTEIGIAFYDESGAYISGAHSTNTGSYQYAYSLTVPSGAKLMRISLRTASADLWIKPKYPWGAFNENIQVMLGDINKNSYGISELNSETSLIVNNAKQTFYTLGTFARGGLNTDGSLLVAQPFRVSSTSHIIIDRDVFVNVKSGYRCGYIPFVEGTAGAWSGWFTSDFTIPKGTEFVLQLSTYPEIQNVYADINTFVNAFTINTIMSDATQSNLMINKHQMTSGSLQTQTITVGAAEQWLSYLHKIPVNPSSIVKIILPNMIGVNWRYRFGWYASDESIIDQIALTADNFLVVPSNAYYFAFGFVATDQNGTALENYNLLENFPSDDIIQVTLGEKSDGLASTETVVKWAHDTFISKPNGLTNAGYSYASDMVKHNVYCKQVGTLLCRQGFCKYDGKWYSVEEGRIGVQDSSFNTISSTEINIGHGNDIQVGESNIAYINGATDHKVYAVNLDTLQIVDTINLPFEYGAEAAVIDEINNIAYILHTDEPRLTPPSSFIFVKYDLTNETIISTQQLSFKIENSQAAQLYEGKILLVAGNNTNTNNRLYVLDLNGTIIGGMKLNIFADDEPEGVFYDADTGDLYISSYLKKLYLLKSAVD